MMYYLAHSLTVETRPSVLRGKILLKIKTALGIVLLGKLEIIRILFRNVLVSNQTT